MPDLPCPWGDYTASDPSAVTAGTKLAMHVWNNHKNEPRPPKLPRTLDLDQEKAPTR